MEYRVFKTETFIAIFSSLEFDEKIWIDKIAIQLEQNPRAGKPLKFQWFRGKKFKGKRLYFLVYDNLGKILFVAFAGKREQQRIIDSILRNSDIYQRIAEEL